MKFRRFLLTVLTPLLLIGIACQTPTNVTDDAQFAKGGMGGGMGGGNTAVLDEYWIFQDGSGNVIHATGSGSVGEVHSRVVFDYFFNGVRDDNPPIDTHFEVSFPDPLATATTTTDG